MLLSSLWSVTSAAETPERWDTFRPLLLMPPPALQMLPEAEQLTLRLELTWSELPHHYADDATAGLGAGLGLRHTLPTLFHYRSDDSAVSLTLAPGSPCTGACLKVAGAF